jgi:hypothetical protein
LRRSEFYEGWDPKQKELIEKLKGKLVEYGMKISHISSMEISSTFGFWRGRRIEIMDYEK